MHKLVLFLAGLSAALAAQSAITCPKCTDPYDFTSCTQTQRCHNSHDVCELQVHLADKNRLSYVCHNSHACTNHEAHACDVNHHEMCAYCCSSIDACKKQREDVYSKLQTSPSVTTAAPAGSTMPPAGSTMPPAGSTMALGGSTMPSGSTGSMSKCIQCGSATSPCTAVELLLELPSDCPASKPYCFNNVVQTPTDTRIVKGCMDMPTCEQEWWNATSPKAECQVVDPTTPATLDCTFCCQGDGCNKDTKPVDTTLLQFNP